MASEQARKVLNLSQLHWLLQLSMLHKGLQIAFIALDTADPGLQYSAELREEALANASRVTPPFLLSMHAAES